MNRVVSAGTWFGVVLAVAGLVSVSGTVSAQDAGARRARDAGPALATIDAGAMPMADAGVIDAGPPIAVAVEPVVEPAPLPEPEPEPEPTVTPAPTPAPTVESSSASTAPSADAAIPLRFELHGYYRARLVWDTNVPIADGETTPAASGFGAFAFMRLRLDPAITYGTDAANPIAALRMQIDALDNVMFGDNARIQSTPLFGETPSMTDIDGYDVQPFRLRRAWLEFLLPIGQIRIGRQASQGGMGILFNDGNGFKNDWGDAQYGTTFDRLLFATRPLTIYNAIAKGDARPTPLILAIGHDWLVEDPVGLDSTAPYLPYDAARGTGAPPTGSFGRSVLPFQNVLSGANNVGQSILVLAWNDPKINPLRTTDELSVGAIGVYRYQNVTDSSIYIGDLFWKTRLSPFGNRAPQIVFNGEIETIQGSSQGLAIGQAFVAEDGGACGDASPCTGRTARAVGANVWGAVVQGGVAMDKKWAAMLEWGYSSGDNNLFRRSDYRFDQRPLHPDYHVGLLLYQVALAIQTADTLPSRALWSRGGVWNSMYWFPQVRYSLMSGVEVVGAFLLAWADTLNEAFPFAAGKREDAAAAAHPGDANAIADSTLCSAFDPDCFLGWEADVALKVSWGENDLMRWSTEFGIMNAGGALAPELANDLLWTLQMRIAMVF